MSVATLTFQIFSFNNLAAGLMFKLVVFAQELEAKAACETPTAMLPNTALALDTLRVPEDARASVTLQTLSAVTNPGLAEVADGPHHLHTRGVLSCMLDHTVARLHHAFLFAALRTYWKTLNSPAKVTESAILLTPFALVAFHAKITRLLYY